MLGQGGNRLQGQLEQRRREEKGKGNRMWYLRMC